MLQLAGKVLLQQLPQEVLVHLKQVLPLGQVRHSCATRDVSLPSDLSINCVPGKPLQQVPLSETLNFSFAIVASSYKAKSLGIWQS